MVVLIIELWLSSILICIIWIHISLSILLWLLYILRMCLLSRFLSVLLRLAILIIAKSIISLTKLIIEISLRLLIISGLISVIPWFSISRFLGWWVSISLIIVRLDLSGLITISLIILWFFKTFFYLRPYRIIWGIFIIVVPTILVIHIVLTEPCFARKSFISIFLLKIQLTFVSMIFIIDIDHVAEILLIQLIIGKSFHFTS